MILGKQPYQKRKCLYSCHVSIVKVVCHANYKINDQVGVHVCMPNYILHTILHLCVCEFRVRFT